MTLSKEKIKDTSKAEKDFKWKKIPHVNVDNCEHCLYLERENEFKAKCQSLNDNQTTTNKDENGQDKVYTLSEVRAVRGSKDDIIGWEYVWQ